MKPVISVEHLTKRYELGVIGTGTLTRDLERWWARVRGQPDPYTRIGQRDAFEKHRESILALDDVSFTVEQGEALGIIGKNGAGKSTLLKILSRVTAPTSGVVKVKGRIGSLLEVGTGFHPELTGRENIYLNGAILGMKKAEVARKFDEIVDFSGVEKFIDTPVKRYSSGMYVRLAFAVAAHLDPEILVVDEVLAVGDAEFQQKCLGKMGDVANKEGRTVLFVSHNMVAVQNLCSKAIIMREGKSITKMETYNAVDQYLNDIETHDHTSQSVNLDNLKGKIRNGPVSFTRFYVEDEQKSKAKVLISGKESKFVLEYKANTILSPQDNVDVSIVIYEKDGFRITNLWNVYDKGKMFNHLPQKGKFICTIPKLPLRTGRYNIDIWCAVNNNPSDWIEFAASFLVEDGDYYGSGKLPDYAKGIVLLDHYWKFEE